MAVAMNRSFLKDGLMTLALTTLVGFVLSVLLQGTFRHNFTYSYAIGLSIFLIVEGLVALRGDGRKTVPIFLIAVPLGSIIGIVIGSKLNGTSIFVLLAERPEILLITSVAALTFGSIISYTFYARQRIGESEREIQTASLQQAQNAQRLTETELRLLQAQIEPHFLFNTLSNILSLIDSHPKNAKQMLLALTVFLRAALKRTREEHTTLGQELTIVSAYLSIQAIRMGSRLSYELLASPELRDIHLPPLLIQPLVENAVQHGLEPKVAGGNITIEIKSRKGLLIIEVTDTGQGLSEKPGTGVGLKNVRARLQGLYGEAGNLTLKGNIEGGFSAKITLPIEKETMMKENKE